jgi:hypothetical protein
MHPPKGAGSGLSNATLKEGVLVLTKKWRDAEKTFGTNSRQEYHARQELRKYVDKLP